MKKELNLALCKLYIGKCNNIKIDDYLFDSTDTQIKSISDIRNYGCGKTIDRYTNYYSGLLKSIFQKHNIDLNEIEKISIYIFSNLDTDNHMYYLLNACNKLGIKYIDLYKIEPDDPRGYYKYPINVDSFKKSKIDLHLELIKGCSSNVNIDDVIYDKSINEINDSDDILFKILHRIQFYFDTIYILKEKISYKYPNIHLYIPENIYNYLEKYLLIMNVLKATRSRYDILFMHCKDKVVKTDLW